MSNTDKTVSLHEEAIKYAKKGILVFPFFPKGSMPAFKWYENATTDLDQINGWWLKRPEYNIGIVTGEKSGIIVIHFLTPEAWVIGQEKGLPVTPIAMSGKAHYAFCRYQEGVYYYMKRAGLTDILLFSDGEYVIAPPSVIGRGETYSWAEGKGFDDLELADIPEWVLDRTSVDNEAISDPVDDDNIVTAVAQPVCAAIQEDMQDTEEVTVNLVLDTKIELPPSGVEVLSTIDSNCEEVCGPLPLKAGTWKAPVLFEGVGVAEIKAALLPSWLGDYAGAISQLKQTPEGLAVMLGLSIVATCVQKRFEVFPYGDDDYSEPLSLWTVTVLNSAERKSPVLNAMRAPIIAWEKEQAELLKEVIRETATTLNVAQKRIDRLQKDASNATDSEARRKIINEISEIQTNLPEEVRAPRLWIADITAETLQDMLAEHGEKMAILSDEGNIFEIMAGLYSDSKVNIDIFLQAYSGSPVRVKRKLRDVTLDRPAFTFGLAVQPVVIESFASGSKKQFRGKGALGRFLFCIPDSMLGRRIVGRKAQIPAEVKSRYEEGIRMLLSVPKAVDETGEEMPRMLELDMEALGTWEDFDRRVEVMLGPKGELSSMGDWGGKLPGTALRIAGLLHLVEYGPNHYIIGKDTLDRSIELCNLLMSHTKAAFGLIGVNEPVSDAKKIFQWMQNGGFKVFTKSDCYDKFKSWNKEQLEKALNDLEERNILKEVLVPTTGKAATNFISNPCLIVG